MFDKLAWQRADRAKNPERYRAYNQRYRERTRAWARDDRKRFPAKYNEYKFKQRYGISLAKKNAMLIAQGGLCAICRERKAAHLDHNHQTKAVRGVLCQPCNHAIGLFLENTEWMRHAICYIEGSGWTGRPTDLESPLPALVVRSGEVVPVSSPTRT